MRCAAVTRGDLHAALEQLTEAAATALNIERSSVWRYNREHTELICLDLFERPKGCHRRGGVLSTNTAPHCFQALKAARCISLSSAQAAPALCLGSHADSGASAALHRYLERHGITAILAAPILLDGRLVGVICHEHVGAPRAFQAWEELVAGTFADFAAMLLGAEARVQQERALDDMRQKLIEQQKLEECWKALAHTDALTGALNRRKLLEVGGQELARAQRENKPLALAMLDVDHFKQINDRYGHIAGDEALQHIAHTVSTQVRRRDHVARYGGEELVLVLPETRLEDAVGVVERIRCEVAESKLVHAGQTLTLTLSAGVVASSADESFVDLMQKADAALYRAKHHGRNCVFSGTGT